MRRDGAKLQRKSGPRPSRTTDPWQTIASHRPFSWIHSGRYTTSVGTVTGWSDLVIRGHSFAAIGSAVPNPAASGTTMGGRKFATFAATNWYQSNLPAASWNFMSDGSGCTAFYVVRRTSVGNCLFHATQAGAARSTGYDWNYDGVNSSLCLGTNPTVNQAAIAINVDRCIAHVYNGTTARTYSNGVQVASGAQAPFAGAVEAMSMGGDVNGSFTSDMLWSASVWFAYAMTAADILSVSRAFRKIYKTA